MAEDSSKQSVTSEFQVNLVSKLRPTNHRFTIYTSAYDNTIMEKAVTTVFARGLTQGLGAHFTDVAPPGRYTILKAEPNGNEITISWFRNDLGNRKKCDREALDQIWFAMTGNHLSSETSQRSKVTDQFKAFLAPEFTLKSAKLTMFGPCDAPPPTEKPDITTMSPPIITPPPPKITPAKTPAPTTTTEKMLPSPPPITPKLPPKPVPTTKSTTTTTKPITTTTTPTPKPLVTTKSTRPTVPKPVLADRDFELIIPASVGKESRAKIPESKFMSLSPVRYTLQAWGDELPLWVGIDQKTNFLVVLPSIDDALALDEINSTHRVWNGGVVAVSKEDGSFSERMRVKVFVSVLPQIMGAEKKANHVFVAKIENYVLEVSF